jgi:hypothetical protein
LDASVVETISERRLEIFDAKSGQFNCLKAYKSAWGMGICGLNIR